MKRFLKYVGVGTSTFGFDLALLFLFSEFLHWNYVLAAGVAFVIAVSVNYVLSRRYVFAGTLRSVHAGYAIFLLIAGVGLGLVTSLMYVCVYALGMNPFLSRVLIAGVVGLWNYVMNLYVNFRVHEGALQTRTKE